jgi:hypothetical protein
MLLVVLWTSGSRTKVQLSPVQRKDVSSQSKTSIDTAVPKSSEPAGVTENTETQVANGSTSETYEVADFVPVPFTDTMGPEDPGMVVRVQLTRSSLADLGYPVAEMPDDDFIRADVLVGVDGWPRGVKLAQ